MSVQNMPDNYYRLIVEGSKLVICKMKQAKNDLGQLPPPAEVLEKNPAHVSVTSSGIRVGCYSITKEALHAINLIWENR